MRWLPVLAFLAVLAACGSADESPSAPAPPPPAPPPIPQPANPAPRLPAGPHMGLVIGFDVLSNTACDQPARVDALLADARLAGASVGRVQISWRDIETAQGVYSTDELDAAIARAMTTGDYVFVTLETIDIASLEFPDYLRVSPSELAPGLTLQSPQVRAALSNMLGFLVPELGRAQIWGLSLGNEVDALVDDGLASQADIIDFYERATARVKELDPDMAVTVTLTAGAPVAQPNLSAGLIAPMDIATFNHYCLSPALQVTPEHVWRDDFDVFKTAAGTKQIFIQELGCPVGFGDDGQGAPSRPANGLGGSPQIQADYMQFALDTIATDPQLRAATLFQLLDWSPQLSQAAGSLLTGGDPFSAALLEEWLATVGLCRWSDGTCRPAWDTFKTGVAQIEAARP